jgi:galactose-1-phosphate uridylyltransferase
LQDYLQEELKLKERIVFENDHFGMVPFGPFGLMKP